MHDLKPTRWSPIWLLPALSVLTAFLYWRGLGGPLVLDDLANLKEFFKFANGETSLLSVLTLNESGILGRPASMASFIVNGTIGGHSLSTLKLTNLLIHLVCGLAIYQLVRQLARLDTKLQERADLLALAVAALWLVAPILTSTILYTIQRMAQLSSLWMVLGLISYISARLALRQGAKRRSALLGLIAFPTCLLLGILSKENGVLLPLLALVVELTLIRSPADGATEKRVVWWFFTAVLFVPGLAASALLLANFSFVLDVYELRDFTLTERLMTQSRVLWSYVGSWLLPASAKMGIFHDGYPVSRGLFTPLTTALSLAAWLLVVAGATFAHRKGYKLVLTGLLLYLIGHSLEAGIFALELYFEHRNYLPGVGVLLAVASALFYVANAPSARLLVAGTVTAFVLATSFVTYQNVSTWSSQAALLNHALQHQPNSARASVAVANFLANQGRFSDALPLLKRAATLRPVDAPGYTLLAANLQCQANQLIDQSTISRLATPQVVVTASSVSEYAALLDTLEAGRCSTENVQILAEHLPTIATEWASGMAERGRISGQWLLTMTHSRLQFWLGKADAAITLAESAVALRPKRHDASIYLAQLQASSGSLEAALATLDAARTRGGFRYWANRSDIESLASTIEQELKE